MRRITAIVLSIAVVFSMAFGVLADAAEETGSDVTQEESLLATNAETDGEEDGLELEIGGVDANTVTVSDGESENLALGKSAFSLLDSLMNGVAVSKVLLRPQLIVRESTGPAPVRK